MRCPRYGTSCSKYNTVRHCPGCALWQQAKQARQVRVESAREARGRQAGSGTFVRRDGQTDQAAYSEYDRSGQSLQPAATDVVYHYDGSLDGLYCCVFECVYLREQPVAIVPAQEAQPTLLRIKDIPLDRDKARRVRASIPAKISGDALDLVETVFLSCLEQKELRILRFLLLGYREGAKTLHMLGHPDVAPMLDAEKHLLKEAHLLKGFVRFSDFDGVLAANITPKNFILPFLANHFCARYAEEEFVIYDKTHRAALLYQNRRRSIVRLEEMPFPRADAAEERYRALWKTFYHTIAIEARTNPRCRMTHMPKRYWENMTEMRELL